MAPPGLQPLAIVVPVHDEPENLSVLVERVERHVPPPFTLYIVYDSESDTTLPTARTLQGDRPWLRLLDNDLAPGVVGAVRAGLRAIREGPTLVTMADAAADLSIVPTFLPVFTGLVVLHSIGGQANRVEGPYQIEPDDLDE